MRLTLQTDFGVRVLLYLAAAPDRRGTVRGIAQAYGISQHHLSKVAARLAGAGLVISSTGRTGGLVLAVDPATVTLGAVVRLTEDDMAIVQCLGHEGPCAIDGVCAAKGAFVRARKAFLDELDRTTLADALGRGNGVRRVLQIAPRPA